MFKNTAKKLRKIHDNVVCGFAGSAADCLALMELLPVDTALEAKIVERTPLPALRQHLHASGWRSLADDGLAQLAQGATSLAELQRILGPLNGRPQ